ncbi:MAG TPA: RHS repeat-associated core domain-containing protein [Stenotrophomonas sp.]
MGLGSPNGDFTIAQDDLVVKVPGGYVRVNRDFDGRQWVFNRQWSGLGNPSYYKTTYVSLSSSTSCTVLDGVSTCDSTANASIDDSLVVLERGARIQNDPGFGRDTSGQPMASDRIQTLARKGIAFTRSSDGSSFSSSKYPRFVVRPQLVPMLPASSGPDAHPVAGKPGQGGIATAMVNGYRWTDRSGQWIEYDGFGRITSYGDRNDVRVWMQYGGKGQVERVLDDNGRTVFTFLYKDDGSFITEVRDHTPATGIRRVQYRYNDEGFLSSVVDARGGETKYGYKRLAGIMPRYTVNNVIDAEGRELKVEYGPTERIAKITAPDGGVTSFDFGYDKLKKEFSVSLTHPATSAGASKEFMQFDQEGRLVTYEANGKQLLAMTGSWRNAKFTDTRGSSTEVIRDNFDEVTQRTWADGSTVKYQYAAGSLDLVQATDEAGLVTQLTYDSKGNVTAVEAAKGFPEAHRTEYTVNARGEPERITSKGGVRADGVVDPDAVVAIDYDSDGNVATLTDAEGNAWHYAYNNLGQVTRINDPNGHATTLTYDAHGNVLSTQDANGSRFEYTYDKTDRPLQVTDPRGKQSSLSYDEAGRLRRLVDPYGAAVQLQYNTRGQLEQASDASQQTARMSYDLFGRIRNVTDGQDNVTGFDYADVDGTDRGAGLVTRVSYPTYQRILQYNQRGWLTKSTSAVEGDPRTVTSDYEVRGLLKTSTNVDGKYAAIEYDRLARPVAVQDQLGNVTRYTYDHRSNVVRVTDARGNASVLSYDRRNKLLEEANGQGERTGYTYDPAGRLTKVVRPSGVSVEMEYDPGGRVVARNAKRADGSLESRDTLEWDPSSHLIAWRTADASAILTYDDNGNLLSEAVTQGSVVLSRSYTYYPNQQIKTYTGPDGQTIAYSYDGNGSLAHMDVPGAGSITLTKREWLSPTEVLYPGGTRISIGRNAYGEAGSLRAISPQQVILHSQDYQRGSLGQVVSEEIDGKATTYAYDDGLRLLEVNKSGIQYDQKMTLDALGNRLTDSQASGDWRYDTANRLVQRGDQSYHYDADGSLLSISGGGQAFVYDAYGRLTEVRDSSDRLVARYSYDPFGYRLSKEVTEVGASETGAEPGKTYFLHGGEGLLAEADGSGAVVRTFGWKPGGHYGSDPVYTRQNGQYYFYVNDERGVPRRVINVEGATVWEAVEYSAFGSAAVAAGNQVFQPWRFAGQYYDRETGLHYNVHRYYDPGTGRYTTSDPLGLVGGFNAYLYANASPTIFNDPYGLWVGVDDAAAIIGGALVGLAVQGAVDLITGNFSGWEQYAGAAVTGAVMGEVMLYTGNPWLAGAAGGLAGNLTTQKLRNLTGKQDGYDVCSMMLDTVLGGAAGKAGELLERGAAALGKKLAGRAGSAAAGASDDVARNVAKGVDDSAKYAQKTYNPNFSKEGTFSGKTVDQVADLLKNGKLSPKDVEVNYIVRDGQQIILNTRSAQALEKAGVPRSQWNGVNRTGDGMYENLLDGQLGRNPGSPFDQVRQSRGKQ